MYTWGFVQLSCSEIAWTENPFAKSSTTFRSVGLSNNQSGCGTSKFDETFNVAPDSMVHSCHSDRVHSEALAPRNQTPINLIRPCLNNQIQIAMQAMTIVQNHPLEADSLNGLKTSWLLVKELPLRSRPWRLIHSLASLLGAFCPIADDTQMQLASRMNGNRIMYVVLSEPTAPGSRRDATRIYV